MRSAHRFSLFLLPMLLLACSLSVLFYVSPFLGSGNNVDLPPTPGPLTAAEIAAMESRSARSTPTMTSLTATVLPTVSPVPSASVAEAQSAGSTALDTIAANVSKQLITEDGIVIRGFQSQGGKAATLVLRFVPDTQQTNQSDQKQMQLIIVRRVAEHMQIDADLNTLFLLAEALEGMPTETIRIKGDDMTRWSAKQLSDEEFMERWQVIPMTKDN